MRKIGLLAIIACSLVFAPVVIAEEGLKLSVHLSEVPASAAAPGQGISAPASGQPTLTAVTPSQSPPSLGVQRARIAEYRIGEEDLLEIKVFGVDQLSSTVRVDPRGLISLPLIGAVQVAGLTAREAQALITASWRKPTCRTPR